MSYAFLAVLVSGLFTLIIRCLPFLLFGGKKETPPYIVYLGRVLPFAIMGMLVVSCLRGISFSAVGEFLPEVIACAVVILAQVWKRNTLISIAGGTICYMLLVQLVF